MVEIPLTGMPPSAAGGGAPLDGMRVMLRVAEALGGGRVVLEGGGIRTEAELPFRAEQGTSIEAVIRHSADRALLEILGPSRAVSIGSGEAAGFSPSLPADLTDTLTSLGVTETAETRAAAVALATEGGPVTAELVREVASLLAILGRTDSAAAQAAARMAAAGLPPAAGLAAATSGAGIETQLAEAIAAMAALAASDPSMASLAAEVAATAVPMGDGEGLQSHFESSAGRLAAALNSLENRAAAQMSASARLATIDRIIEMASARVAGAPAEAQSQAPPPLEALVAPDGSMLAGAEAAMQALAADGAAALVTALLEAEKLEMARSPVSAELARAARSVRALLSRSALARAAAMTEPGAGAMTIDVPFQVGDRTIVARLRIRRSSREGDPDKPPSETFTVAIGVTMSVLGDVTAELRLRRMDLAGALRVSSGEAKRLVENRLDELTEALAEMGFVARISVEEESPAASASMGDVSPDIRKLDLHI